MNFLANKGRIFREMASLPDILDIVHHVLGEEIRIQNLLATIIRSGGQAQTLHQDQWFVPSAGRYDEPMRAGSITRANPGQPETPGATLMPCIVQRHVDAGRLHQPKRCNLDRARQPQARTPTEQGRP